MSLEGETFYEGRRVHSFSYLANGTFDLAFGQRFVWLKVYDPAT